MRGKELLRFGQFDSIGQGQALPNRGMIIEEPYDYGVGFHIFFIDPSKLFEGRAVSRGFRRADQGVSIALPLESSAERILQRHHDQSKKKKNAHQERQSRRIGVGR